MKRQLTYGIFFLSLVFILFQNSSGGPAEVQGSDRTFSPLSGSTFCGTCHTGSAFSPSLTAQILDGGTSVTQYEPGKTYTLKVTVNATGASGYGFQAVALQGSDNANAGDFGAPPAGLQVTTLNNRKYVEHSMRRDTNTFEIPWTAPAAGTGDVRFYAAGVAANANGSSGGDGATRLTAPLTLQEASVSFAAGPDALVTEMTIFPNPAADELVMKVRAEEQGLFRMNVLDLQGKILDSRATQLTPGENTERLDVSGLPAGLYLLQLTDGQRVSTRRFLKR